MRDGRSLRSRAPKHPPSRATSVLTRRDGGSVDGMFERILDRFNTGEDARIDNWTRSLIRKDVLHDALAGLPTGTKRRLGPVVGTDLAPNTRTDWLTSCGVLTFEEEPDRLLVRDVGSAEAPAVELYAVGACRWCDFPAPLGEPRDLDQRTHDNLAMALTVREPAHGHVCPGVAGLLRR